MKSSTIVSITAGVMIVGIGGLILVSVGNSKSNNHHESMNHQPVVGIKTTNQSNNSVTGTNKVTIKDFAFSPAKITIKKGTTVTWTNQDSAHHDVTPDQEHANFKAGPLFGKGETYSSTFGNSGTFAYHCSPHPYMKAVVEVTE